MTNLIRRALSFLPRGNTHASVLILAGGTAAGQAIAVIASPLLTRFYSPAAFGALGSFVSLVAIVSVVSSLRYELAIPLPEDDTSAAQLLALSLIANVLIASALLGALLIFTSAGIPLFTGAWLAPVGVLGAGIYKALNYWAIRKRAYDRVARTKLTQGIGSSGIQVLAGVMHPSALGLIAGQIVGYVAGSSTLATLALKRDRDVVRAVSLRGVWNAAVEHRRFPLWSTWSALANSASVHMPVLVLASYFGQAVTGFYTLGLRVLQTPVSLVAQAVAQVFLSRAAEAHREGRLPTISKAALHRLATIGLPGLIVLGAGAPGLFSIAFGEPWRLAGVYAQWLAPWLAIVFVTSPLTIIPAVVGRQGGELLFQVVLLVGRTTALVLAARAGNAEVAIAIFAAVSAAFWLVFLLWLMSIAGHHPTGVARLLARPVLRALPFAGIVWLSSHLPGRPYGDWPTAVASVACAAGLVPLLRRDLQASTISEVRE